MSVEYKQPPLKKRKLNDAIAEQKRTDTNDDIDKEDCIKCIWCNAKPTHSTISKIDDDKDDNTDCNCNEIASSLKSSQIHKIIEINNAGNSKTKFKCFKLLQSDEKQDSFQIDCKDGNIDFDSIDFQNKLCHSFQTNGIIILRNLFSEKEVLNARYDILMKYLSEYIIVDKNNKDLTMKAQLNGSNTINSSASLLNKAMEVTENTKSVKQILENDKLFKITSILLKSEHIITTKYKWLRCVKPSKFTGLHLDKMYMGANTFNKMLSMWIPFGNINIINGSFLWCYGSHNCSQWNKYLNSINYGDPSKLNKDGTKSGWITDNLGDYFNDNEKEKNELCDHLLWTTTDFQPGDVAIFGLQLIHQTLRNDSNCYRLSCDTRWMPICQPLDKILKNCGISDGLE